MYVQKEIYPFIQELIEKKYELAKRMIELEMMLEHKEVEMLEVYERMEENK